MVVNVLSLVLNNKNKWSDLPRGNTIGIASHTIAALLKIKLLFSAIKIMILEI